MPTLSNRLSSPADLSWVYIVREREEITPTGISSTWSSDVVAIQRHLIYLHVMMNYISHSFGDVKTAFSIVNGVVKTTSNFGFALQSLFAISKTFIPFTTQLHVYSSRHGNLFYDTHMRITENIGGIFGFYSLHMLHPGQEHRSMQFVLRAGSTEHVSLVLPGLEENIYDARPLAGSSFVPHHTPEADDFGTMLHRTDAIQLKAENPAGLISMKMKFDLGLGSNEVLAIEDRMYKFLDINLTKDINEQMSKQKDRTSRTNASMAQAYHDLANHRHKDESALIAKEEGFMEQSDEEEEED